MEVGAYNAVKNATCRKTCLDGGLIQACPASLPAQAPGPSSFLASSALHAFLLPDGSLSSAYQTGALPRGGLSSALQTGALPQHAFEQGPEVLPQHLAKLTLNVTFCASYPPALDGLDVKSNLLTASS